MSVKCMAHSPHHLSELLWCKSWQFMIFHVTLKWSGFSHRWLWYWWIHMDYKAKLQVLVRFMICHERSTCLYVISWYLTIYHDMQWIAKKRFTMYYDTDQNAKNNLEWSKVRDPTCTQLLCQLWCVLSWLCICAFEKCWKPLKGHLIDGCVIAVGQWIRMIKLLHWYTHEHHAYRSGTTLYNAGNSWWSILSLSKLIICVWQLKALTRQNVYQYQSLGSMAFKKAK